MAVQAPVPLLLLLTVPLSALAGTVTPVQKVIKLLGNLEKQTIEEGAKEAAEYDRFACFCKEQASAKLYAIERSTEKIGSLTASIGKLTTEITDLDSEITTLGGEITTLEGDIGTEEAARKVEFDAYVIANKNVTEAIEAVQDAIKAIQEMKGQMTGDVDLDLHQAQQMVAHAFRSSSGQQAPVEQRVLESLVQASEPGSPHAYKYRSNDIIGTLRWLERSFKENKQTLDQEEFLAASDSDKKLLGLMNEKKFKEKSKTEKEELSAKKSAEKSALEKDKDQEQLDKDSDTEFQTELKVQCEAKATEWDSRSQGRAAELTAIAEATEILKAGVSTTYEANKKLVGLVAARRVPVRRLGGVAEQKRAPSASPVRRSPVTLLQLRGATDHSRREVGVQRVKAQLALAATRLNSRELSALGTKLELQEDHFVKVRGLINDLITTLETAASSEASEKSFCDTEMSKAVGSRDTENENVETQLAIISSEKAKAKALKQEIAALSADIANLNKALKEATELRLAEKKDNEQTVADAGAGKTAVEQAISVLEKFYNAFAQVGYKPPKSDRAGNTVGDLAPESSFSGSYTGNKDASKGILGLLQVILSDFERTKVAVQKQESEAVTAYNGFKTETKGSIETKEGLVTTKEGEVDAAEVAVVSAEDALQTATGLKMAALKELEELQAKCVQSEDSYAERREKREQEIEALREALRILEDWQQ